MSLSPAEWERVVPQEEPFCEWCGHYLEFCTCKKDIEEEDPNADV